MDGHKDKDIPPQNRFDIIPSRSGLYKLCINYYYNFPPDFYYYNFYHYNFPPDFSATFDDGGFPQSAFLLSLSQTNKGRTNFQEIVHSIQI